MKKSIIIPVIAIVCLASFYGCKKSSSTATVTPIVTPATVYSMTASINGSNYFSSNCFEVSTSGVATLAGFYGTSASSAAYPVIQFGIFYNDSVTVGTYTIDNITNLAVIDSSSTSNSIAAAYGIITVTSVWPNIVGTFSFTCTDSTRVTKGAFTCKKS